MKKYNIKIYEKIKSNDVGADASVRLEMNYTPKSRLLSEKKLY